MDKIFVFLIPTVLTAWTAMSFLLYKTKNSRPTMTYKTPHRRKTRRILELQ